LTERAALLSVDDGGIAAGLTGTIVDGTKGMAGLVAEQD
jgi:hypothetical protein